MSCANFKSMRDFPLIAAETPTMKVCPDCGITNPPNGEKCEDCGCDLTNTSIEVDEFYADEIVREMETWAEQMTKAQDFYKVTVESGHYTGYQFYVEDKYYKPETWTNDESQEELGLCRSRMLRKYKAAGNLIRRILRKSKKALGLYELGVTARFSNGEVWYAEIKPDMPKREALKVALNSVA